MYKSMHCGPWSYVNWKKLRVWLVGGRRLRSRLEGRVILSDKRSVLGEFARSHTGILVQTGLVVTGHLAYRATQRPRRRSTSARRRRGRPDAISVTCTPTNQALKISQKFCRAHWPRRCECRLKTAVCIRRGYPVSQWVWKLPGGDWGNVDIEDCF